MKKVKILWTDDEIEILKPHILFLTGKGYDVDTCTNGTDTIDLVGNNAYDIVFLDENMPGMSGIDTLKAIKEIMPDLPVVMITRSEEENIMEAAIGSKIADYLIKPVKPNQILLCLKRIIESSRLVSEMTTSDYQAEFSRIRMMIDSASDFTEWEDVYRKLVYWDLQLDTTGDPGLREIYRMQEQEANLSFSKFISRNYSDWFSDSSSKTPLLSPSVIASAVIPLLRKGEKVVFILVDNLRYDQWKVIQGETANLLKVIDETLYYSILPTATQYSRNAIFAGRMPMEIEKSTPEYWVWDDESEGKNKFEKELLESQLARHSVKCRWSYDKIGNNATGKKINDNISSLLVNDLVVLVYNFVDLISHARTDIGLIRDIANDEPAYRSLTRSWFIHSPLMELIRKLQGTGVKVVLTTDHGTIRVNNPVKVIGDRQTSSNLRYKMGRNLDYDERQVFEVPQPSRIHLPKSNITSKYIFARGYDFLVYPNNYNHFVSYYRNTFQHGGISLQEMILPLVILEPVN
ncbi:MAG: PglZ domain-containing protein [Bacteroidia bacterium]|nr:MAG: PglZ domain-containing protein [Bacteroidia bacterium]